MTRGQDLERQLSDWLEAGPVVAPGALCGLLRTLPPKRVLGKGRKWLRREPAGSEARVAAWEFLISQAADQKDAQTLHRWARHRPAELRDDGRLWNAVGEALLEVNATKEGVKWLSDWRERPDDW